MVVGSACGSNESTDTEEPLSEAEETPTSETGHETPTTEAEQEAQEKAEIARVAYDETYEIVYPHVTENYDSEAMDELCENAHNFDPEFDYDGFIEGIMDEAGVQVEGETREYPEYQGAFDATDTVVLEACGEHQ